MCSGAGHTTWLVRGSPIRKSSDQRSVDSSPRLIAASYVLHRLLVPRHPPCALNNLTTHNTHAHPPHRPEPEGPDHGRGSARISRQPLDKTSSQNCPKKDLARCARPRARPQRTEDDRPPGPARPRTARAVRRQNDLLTSTILAEAT